MLGGSKSKPKKNDNNNVYRQPTFADIMGIQEGTGGVYNPITPDPYTGFGSTTQYEEPVHSDFGMTPQAYREEYFGPTNWEPGIGNEHHQPSALAAYEAAVASTIDKPILDSKSIKKQVKKYSGPREQWTPGAGNEAHKPSNILQAVEAPRYSGHPSAGDLTAIDVSSASLDDLAFEQFGDSTVYPTIDMQLSAPSFGDYFGSAEQPFVSSRGSEESLLDMISEDLDLPIGGPVYTSGQDDIVGNPVYTTGPVDEYGIFEEEDLIGRAIEDYNHRPDMLNALQQSIGGRGSNVGIDRYEPGIDFPGYDRFASGALVRGVDRDPQGTLPASWPEGQMISSGYDQMRGHDISSAVRSPRVYGPSPDERGSATNLNADDIYAWAAAAEAEGQRWREQDNAIANSGARSVFPYDQRRVDTQGTIWPEWPREETKYIPTVLGNMFPYNR